MSCGYGKLSQELYLQIVIPPIVGLKRNEKEILELDDESKDVFKRNMLDRYIERLNSIFANGIYSGRDQFCYAEFLLACQPDEILEINHDALMYPRPIPLMSHTVKVLVCDH